MACPTPATLERFWLSGENTEELESHVDSCAQCKEKVRAWGAERRAFLQKYPFERFEREALADDGLFSRFSGLIDRLFRPFSVWKTSLAFATIAALALVILLPRQDSESILSKGGAGMGFYVLQGGKGVRGEDKMRLRPGDELKFYYSSDEPAFLLLIGVEEDASMHVYYPSGGGESRQISRGDKVFLPESIRWLPHTRYERFYAFFSKKPVSAQDVGDKVAETFASGMEVKAAERLPFACMQFSFVIYNNEN